MDDEPTQAPAADSAPVGDPGPVHVHGLGENPRDGALFIATHTGLFRLERSDAEAERIAGRYQDTMGFTVVGPDEFLGSGHPDGRDGLPPFLGLIRSTNAGESWGPLSLEGEADFHVLETRDNVVYGYGSDWETRTTQLLVSEDGGRRWGKRREPEPLASLAIDPDDARRSVAAGERGLHASSDGGRRWRALDGPSGLLSWSRESGLFVVAGDGAVHRAGDGRFRWKRVGDVGGAPAAFETAGRGELYVALHDGTIKRSEDDGRTWRTHYTPR